MNALKKSLSLSPQTVAYIQARSTAIDEISWSEEVNQAYKLLAFFARNSLPCLNESEWNILLNTYTGCITPNMPFRIASDIMDNCGEIDLENLPAKVKKIVQKAHSWSQVEQFAVLDMINKFWSKEHVDFVNLEDLMDKLKFQ